MMDDGIGLADALLGLDGFGVLDVAEGPDELVTVESKAMLGVRCGVRAKAQDRLPIDIRDLSCFGRPARLVLIKRRWRCVDTDCDAKTWTEHSHHVDAQAVLIRPFHCSSHSMLALAHYRMQQSRRPTCLDCELPLSCRPLGPSHGMLACPSALCGYRRFVGSPRA